MNQEILDYISSLNVGVSAVEMNDGSPHAATLHFAHSAEPLSFIFLTDRSYRKCEPLIAKGETRASFVLGQNETDMRTLQMDGTIKFAEGLEPQDTYFKKFPKKAEKFETPRDVFLVFAPTWWRYTNFSSPTGKLIISSED